MVRQTPGDVANDQTMQASDNGGDNNRVTTQARDQAFGPQQRRTPGDHPGPGGTNYHVDEQGRVDSLTNKTGETTQIKYAEGSSQIQSYSVVDKSGKPMEQSTRGADGNFKVGDTTYKNVKVGRDNQLQLIDSKGVSHERLLGGNSIRVDDRMPRTTEGVRPVQAEVSRGGHASYEWSTTQGPDGRPVSQMDNYTITDNNNPPNIEELGIRSPNGRWLTYRPKPGEAGLRKDDVDKAKQLMKDDPNLFAEKRPLDKNLDTDGIDCPTSVTVDKNGNRIENFVNGEKTRCTSSGVVDRWHADGRYSQTIRGADGQPHLTYTESVDPQTGEKKTEQFSYDQTSGALNKYTESKQVIGQDGQPHAETHVYSKNGEQWVDETGKPADFAVQDNHNGSVSLVKANSRHTYNDDGSELFQKQHNGRWLTERELTSSGGDTRIKYDGNDQPNDVEYHWPGKNGSRPVVEHLQRFQDPYIQGQSGEYWMDTSVRGGPTHYAHASVDQYGTINYVQNGRIIRQDDPRDLPRAQQTAAPVKYQGSPSVGYNPKQTIWNPAGDPTINNGQDGQYQAPQRYTPQGNWKM